MKRILAFALAILTLLASLGVSIAAEEAFKESEDEIVNSLPKGTKSAVVTLPTDTKLISGLDDIVGVTSNTTVTIPVLEDTYIEGGSSSNTNFGSAEMMDFKALSLEDPNDPLKYVGFYRVPLLKFDISNLDKDDVLSVVLSLECYVHQTPGVATTVNVYGCDPLAWSENKVTYNTRPESEICVSTALVSGKGFVNFDVTDYVIECLEFGDTEVSFALEGDGSPEALESVKRLNFKTKESKDGTAPYLNVTCGDYAFSTDFTYEGKNPWTLAMRNVSDWLRRWEEIKKGGDVNTELVVKRDSEYTVTVDACQQGQTDGANTRYTQTATRLVSTLENYTPDFSEQTKLDIYGGLMDESLKQEATGFFYTKKIGDRWWNIDPLGYPFYRTAVVNVKPGYSSSQTKTVLAKYGTVSDWAQATTDRLRELGFNSLGNWSDMVNLIKVNAPLSQTERWNIMSTYATERGIKLPTPGDITYTENVMPVFDPEFLTSAMKSVEAATRGYAGASAVYGWFSDNELPSELNTLDYSLKKDPKDPKWTHTYATAWTFMYMKTGNINVTRADITDELRLEYRAMVYDKYFSVAKLCRDKYAPKHQYFGSRFTGGCYQDEYIVRVAGYYCDVISLNYYGAWSAKPTVLENLQKWSGKPFVITEWYAKGMDVWEKDNRFVNKGGAGFTVRDQESRGKFYQNFALSLLECKGCVGFDWFEYMDIDPNAPGADLSNKGMHDVNGEEYAELTSSMQIVNTQKYNLVSFFDER